MMATLDLEERPQDEQQAIGLLQDEVTVSSMIRKDGALGLGGQTSGGMVAVDLEN